MFDFHEAVAACIASFHYCPFYIYGSRIVLWNPMYEFESNVELDDGDDDDATPITKILIKTINFHSE